MKTTLKMNKMWYNSDNIFPPSFEFETKKWLTLFSEEMPSYLHCVYKLKSYI